jgi:hypothetical protein
MVLKATRFLGLVVSADHHGALILTELGMWLNVFREQLVCEP